MNEAFKLLFDQVKSGIVWVQRNGAVRYANKAAVQMTPVMLGQAMMDPVAERTVKAAGQGMLNLPFSFELTTQEAHPDTIRLSAGGSTRTGPLWSMPSAHCAMSKWCAPQSPFLRQP